MITVCTLVGLFLKVGSHFYCVFQSNLKCAFKHLDLLLIIPLISSHNMDEIFEGLQTYMCSRHRIKAIIDVGADEMVELAFTMEDGKGGEDKKQENI